MPSEERVHWMCKIHKWLLASADRIRAALREGTMNSNALAQLKKEHADMSNLHRVSLRSAVFISLMSTSLGGKKDRPSSVSSFLGTTLLDNPKTRIFEILSACCICRPYSSTMQLMKGISLGGAPLLEKKVDELVGLMSGGDVFVWSVICSRNFCSRSMPCLAHRPG